MSLQYLAHHAVRLWRSPRRWPRGATNPVQIRWKSHVLFPLFWGRWPSLIRVERMKGLYCNGLLNWLMCDVQICHELYNLPIYHELAENEGALLQWSVLLAHV